MIEVEPIEGGDPLRFRVRVTEGDGASEHRVEVPEEDHERIAPSHEARDLVEASFEFLLDREPKESILQSFELATINRYFPEYEDEIGSYL